MRVYFSTDHVPPRDREPFWLDVVAKHVMKMTLVDRPDPATFRAQLDVRVAGRFTLFDYQTSHRIGKRTAADVSRGDAGKFQLRRVAGQQIYTAATRASAADLRLGPRDFCVTSTAWPYQSLMENGTSGSGLLIPHGVLSPLLAGGRLIRPVRVSGASPLGSLLGVAFDAAVTQLPLLSLELGEAVLQNLCGLVALACGASDEGRWSGRESLRATQLEAAKLYVDDHLSEPNLTPGNARRCVGNIGPAPTFAVRADRHELCAICCTATVGAVSGVSLQPDRHPPLGRGYRLRLGLQQPRHVLPRIRARIWIGAGRAARGGSRP